MIRPRIPALVAVVALAVGVAADAAVAGFLPSAPGEAVAVQTRPGVTVWLIGTSRGSVSAANVAARLQGARAADGLVLTSTVSKPSTSRKAVSRDDVFDVDLSQIRVPTLIVYHRDDACDVVDRDDAPRMQREMANAPVTELMTFEGGDPPQSRACGPLSPHGFLGIEGKVMDAIADWILAAKH